MSTNRIFLMAAPNRKTTMSHQFKLGQRVRQSRASEAADRNARGEIYEVIRLVPEDRGGSPGYRIKSSSGERAVTQDDIVLA